MFQQLKTKELTMKKILLYAVLLSFALNLCAQKTPVQQKIEAIPQGNFSSMELFHPKEAEPEEAEIFGKSVKGFQLFLADEKNWQALQKTIPQNLR